MERGKTRMMMKFLPVSLALLLLSAGTAPAQQMPASCQTELDTLGQARLSVINRINGFSKKRPTAKQACSVFGELVGAEAKMLKWMQDNQDWCRLPDALIANFKEGSQQAVKARGQACTAAKRQAEGGGAAPRGPAPGSGVRLPQGAL
jgi:hypothetical protein